MTKSKLVVVTEGGESMLTYFKSRGFYPNIAIFDSIQLSDLLGYVDTNMHFLLIIHGMTDFSNAEVLRILGLLGDIDNLDVRVLTDVPLDLSKTKFPQLFYRDDIFRGDFELDDKDKKAYGMTSISAVKFWEDYDYAFEDKEVVVGTQKCGFKQVVSKEEEIIKKSLVDVDLFAN